MTRLLLFRQVEFEIISESKLEEIEMRKKVISMG